MIERSVVLESHPLSDRREDRDLEGHRPQREIGMDRLKAINKSRHGLGDTVRRRRCEGDISVRVDSER
jgi:hypothetical protein